jgi:Flp pilus assembly protein TadD
VKAPLTISLPRRVLLLAASIVFFVLVFHSYIASLNMWRGEQYFMNKKYAESIKAFRKATLLAPKNSQAYSSLGWLYTRTGREDLASQSYERALRLNPRDAQSQFELGMVFFKEGRLAEALERFRSASLYNSDSLTAHIMVALSWERKGEPERALEQWKRIRSRFPEAKMAEKNIDRLSKDGGSAL